MPLTHPRLGADVRAEAVKTLEWLGAVIAAEGESLLNIDHNVCHHIIFHHIYLPHSLLSCRDAGTILVIKLDNFVSLHLRSNVMVITSLKKARKYFVFFSLLSPPI